MHDQPITLILARRDAGSPDFSGPGIIEARRELMMEPIHESPPDSPPEHAESPPDSAGHKDMHAELMDIAKQLRKASKMHAGQADRIEEICKCLMEDGAESPPDDYHGEARELT